MADVNVLIVGNGPAACSAALTARARGLSVRAVGSGTRGWLARAEKIANYPGMPEVSGRELLETFRKQAEDAGAVFSEGMVRQLQPVKNGIMALIGSDIVTADAVILAMGAARPRLLPGEEELLGQGVSWCGTCDGMFYRGRRVAVISYWQGGVEEGSFLARLCSQVDYYMAAPHELPPQPAFTVKAGRPEALTGDGESILLTADGQNEAYDGVFVFRPAVAADRLLPGLKVSGPFIDTDRTMRTSVPRVYAAGDCTGQPLQIAKAVGEGCVAAISAAEDLAGGNE